MTRTRFLRACALLAVATLALSIGSAPADARSGTSG